MSVPAGWRRRRHMARAAAVVVMVAAVAFSSQGGAVQADRDYDPTGYVGDVEVVRTGGAPDGKLRGVVFDDRNKDSRRQRSERGVKGVAVSNGRDVVLTDSQGRYELTAYDNMTVFVTKPAGWDVPVDATNFPKFYYHHSPNGSPELRFGGLAPTGPLPSAVNFPLTSARNSDRFNCAVVGDTQTYSNREISYLRDGVVEDLAARDDLAECGALLLGDLMGDDLGLYPRFKQVMAQANVPIRAVPGNHDLDFDAPSDENSMDTYRREIGPAYYSYDVGDVHFVGLDNMSYPCTPAENADGKHAFCDDPAGHPAYNGIIGDRQMSWLANDLKTVPRHKLVVVATHIPLVSYIDMSSTQHQTDDVTELYALLEGRPALSVSGHTHTLENMSTGTSYGGWAAAVGVDALPFPHIVAGAACGSWWGGDLDADGIPMAFGRNGTPGGYATLSINGSKFASSFDVTTFDDSQTMGISLNSPRFRAWAQALIDFQGNGTPPVNINDLGDPDVVARADLDQTWLVANVYNGNADTRVSLSIDGGKPIPMTHTQPGDGENILRGLEYGDPFALSRQLQVARHAFRSTSGDPRSQGYERFRGTQFGPADPRKEGDTTIQSPHIWRLALPQSVPVGVHTAKVRSVDPRDGARTQTFTFEIVEQLPPWNFRTEVFQD